MVEKLDVYDLDGKQIAVLGRKKFYLEIRKEFAKTGKISKQIKSIRCVFMNSNGRIYLQKRSNLKDENPGLYDKAVGGHVALGDSFDMTMIKESAEELGFPVAILPLKDFEKALKVTNLNVIGLFRQVECVNNFESIRRSKDGSFFIQPYICAFYIGYYDGAICFVDGESSGIEVFSLSELKEEIKNNPQKFTEDIKFMVEKYEKYLKPIK